MPRVLQVVLSLNPGGTERLVVELAKRLHHEYPMAICCLDEPGAWAAELDNAGIQVQSLARRPGFRPGLGLAIARLARQHGATVVHAHHYSPFVYSAIARVFKPGLRVVFTEHGRLSDAGPSPKRRRANRFLRRLASDVFAVSRDVRQHLIAEGFRREQVGVIYNGIDVEPTPDSELRSSVRRDLGLSAVDLVVGTVARLDPVKDLPVLIDAVATLASTAQPVTLLVIGDGDRRRSLESYAAALGVAERVRFLGYQRDVGRWLAACDVYANSSVSEGVSLTILEAMAAGLPVVATAVGGTPEILTGECGALVPARSPEALANAIYGLGQSSVRRRQMGAAGRQRVETHFTLDRMVQSYRTIYARPARPSSPGSS
jgi:glycosyltransferase involved in cell wall biosynthesis